MSSFLSSRVEITYLAQSRKPITSITVFINGRPITKTSSPREIASPDGTIATFSIDLPQKDSAISLIAANANGTSEPSTRRLLWQGPKEAYKPDLWVLAAGVTKYKEAQLNNLAFPDKDAKDFIDVMHEQEGGLYKEVHVYPFPLAPLTNERARHDEILKGLSWLKSSTKQGDVAMLFLAGHGESDVTGNYHYLPFDADHFDFDLTTVQDYEILGYLSKVPGKVIAFLDTCFSGKLQNKEISQPDLDKLANKLASSDNGVIVFSSSTGQQFSEEKPEWNNGAFTKALVEALKGKAVHGSDGKITITALGTYVSARVEELTNRQQSPPMPIKPKTITEGIDQIVIATVVP